MTTQFPNGIDTFPRPVATDPLSNPAHAALHTNVSDAVVAMQQNVGVTGETNPATVRGALLGKAAIGHTHNYAPLVHGHAITDVTNLRSELDALQDDINNATVSPLTTKGDLFGFAAAEARIPVGLPGQILAADPAAIGGVRWRDEIIAPVGGITLNYRFDNAVAAAGLPSGQYRLNNAAPTSATQMFVNSLTQPGNDASVIWNNLDSGDFMTFWKTSGGPAASQGFKLTSKPVAAGVAPNKIYTFGIAQVVAPQGTIANNNDVAINTISTPAATLPAGGNQGHVLTKQSGTDYDVAWESGRWVLRGGDTMTGPLGLFSRLLGDFTGPVAGRVFLQSNVANGFTSIGALPNGTSTTALFGVHNSSDVANNATLQIRANANEVMLNSDIIGAGVVRPLQFRMGNVSRGSLNTDGSWTFLTPLTGNGVNPFSWQTSADGRVFIRDAGGVPAIQGANALGNAFGPLQIRATKISIFGPLESNSSISATALAAAHASGWAMQSVDIGGSPSRGGIWADGPNAIRLVTASFGSGVRLDGVGNQIFLDAAGGVTSSGNFTVANGGGNIAIIPAIAPGRPAIAFGPSRFLEWNSNIDQWVFNGGPTLSVVGAEVMTTANVQTITGRKTFTDRILLRNVPLDAGLNGIVDFGLGVRALAYSEASDLYIFFGPAPLIVEQGSVISGSDNIANVGSPSNRWSQVFAAVGTINTSDAREKSPLAKLTANEIAAAKELGKAIGTYKWLDAIAKKGDGARIHIGVTAQDVISIMEAHGLDAMRYGFVCYDEWEAKELPTKDAEGETDVRTIAAGDRYGVRYEQLLAFIAAGFEARLAALEGA